MTTTPDVLPVPAVPAAADVCGACIHDLSEHDAISLRFCRATLAIASSRSCICPS